MSKEKVTEGELLERVTKVLEENVSREDFVEEVNRILGTEYKIENVEWRE